MKLHSKIIGLLFGLSLALCLVTAIFEDADYKCGDYTFSEYTPATERVNLNTADSHELQSLYGIGNALAENIISFRTERRSFETIYDLKLVSGIGDTRFERLKPYICVK